jgi:hypothetical protein
VTAGALAVNQQQVPAASAGAQDDLRRQRAAGLLHARGLQRGRGPCAHAAQAVRRRRGGAGHPDDGHDDNFACCCCCLPACLPACLLLLLLLPRRCTDIVQVARPPRTPGGLLRQPRAAWPQQRRQSSQSLCILGLLAPNVGTAVA